MLVNEDVITQNKDRPEKNSVTVVIGLGYSNVRIDFPRCVSKFNIERKKFFTL